MLPLSRVSFVALHKFEECWFFCTSHEILECDKTGMPNHGGLPIEKIWNELFDSPWDELASILPIGEIIGGYYREVGVTFNGGKLLLDKSNHKKTNSPFSYNKFNFYLFSFHYYRYYL